MVDIMKKYRFLIGFFVCLLASSGTLLGLDYIWPPSTDVSILNILIKSFVISVIVAIVLYATFNKRK